jgi:hypothetical protein
VIRQDGSQFFEQVRSIGRSLELLNHGDHDVVVDTFCVDFEICLSWRRWRGVDNPALSSAMLKG